MDFTCEVGKDTNAEEINTKFLEASKGDLKGYLRYVDEPLVSSDFVGDTHSAVFDSDLTSVVGNNLVKVIAWYDNEYGYSSRVSDVRSRVAKRSATSYTPRQSSTYESATAVARARFRSRNPRAISSASSHARRFRAKSSGSR